MDALAFLGLLGLIVPKEFGGLGQSHVCAAMVVETIARYGCSSTAMVYGESSFHEKQNSAINETLNLFKSNRYIYLNLRVILRGRHCF